MYDASKEMGIFYDTHVRLGETLRNDLAGYRDLNLGRLTDGLKALGDLRNQTYASFVDWKNQGSYAMHTLNQCEHTDYDIDVAVIFEQADLPEGAAAARTRICDALAQKCTNFTKEPEARKNAVTVWYADGYHIDFAIYRRRRDWHGNVVIEHAGGEDWTSRDPAAFTDWFTNQVSSKSPPTFLDSALGTTVTVQKGQLRRIVRLVKAFAKSRSSWSLPGGIIISTLVCEVYKSSSLRDDVALVDTLRSLLTRLKTNIQVENPAQPGMFFTSSERRRREVERLRDVLDEKLPSLDVLNRNDCTPKQAMSAWNEIFYHSYWSETKANLARSDVGDSGLTVDCWLANKEGGAVYRQHQSDSKPLPKGVHLRFRATPTGVALPYTVRWSVRNEGHEAKEDGALAHDSLKNSGEFHWTSTAYRGRHTMLCEILKDGLVVRRAQHFVRIAPGRWFR